MKKYIISLLSILFLLSCGTSSTEPLLHVNYAGTLSGIKEFEDEEWKEIKKVSPFVNDINESQMIKGETIDDLSNMVLYVEPQDKATIKVEGINSKQVYYEGKEAILLVSAMDPLTTTTRITVSKGNDSIIYEPSFRYDRPRLRIESERIIDKTKYEALDETLFLPIYQTSCMSIVYYIPEIHDSLEKGEKIAPPLFDTKINDKYFLVFGYGDDPENGKVDMYYAVRPFNFTIYQSKDLKEWELISEDNA